MVFGDIFKIFLRDSVLYIALLALKASRNDSQGVFVSLPHFHP
jgi:hypothetical protein